MKPTTEQTAAAGGFYTFGTFLAIVLSWTAHQSLGWAVLHGCLSWLYVIWYLFLWCLLGVAIS